ncbi:hypothetical protein COV49_02445 [Candidatus Falkowbacteria bacterium CG11_big_fil_rev_8_21_14_0_20_39_10]|uniref:Uncharacterized protein n=1 Tax=Candidatus Falkowbacteria bacterium CG11_big_fil_rev_8_21_14_0_20_39_10 TaxID=1974570 RepID=A0A2M6K8Y5_9BACT|nr:MAG: hypothetical protein COV49_02445 [Candidatus Falkowbacteria bacterium CG11_big_fil_rev_8_21_14_0_20_39_10]
MQKKASKILIMVFLLIFILQLASLIFLLLTPQETKASLLEPGAKAKFQPQVQIPGLNVNEVQPDGSTKAIGNYIVAIYKYAIGIVGILAAVVLMWGGVLWLTAGGNAERIGNAKSWIMASLSGLVLALASFMILSMINPDLVNFKIKNLTQTASNAKYCCSYKLGPFSGFMQTNNNKQEYSCTPVPTNMQPTYGDTPEYNPNTQVCEKQNDNTYKVISFGCCACTSTNCPNTFSFVKCHEKTTKTECDVMSASSSYTWTSFQQNCDKYPDICKKTP